MELRHLQAFVVVAEELNFRRAADRLHVSQPPLSQQIKRLENEVGTSLFHRTTRHVALTPAGEAFLEEARHALKAAQAAPHVARRAAAGQVGVVRLGFTGPASYQVLLVMVRRFREHRPAVRLDIIGPLFGGELVERLGRHDLDAGLVRLPVAGTGLHVRELTRHHMAVALPAEHHLATRREIALRDLRDEPFISYPSNRGSAINLLVRTACLNHGFRPEIVQEAPDTHTILALVGAGVGIGLVPTSARHLEVPGVVQIPVSGVPAVPLALAWREEDRNPALHALHDLLDEIAAELRSQ